MAARRRHHEAARRRSMGIGTLVFALALLVLLALRSVGADELPRPSAELEPDEVVAIVVDALQANPELEDDAGIATVFSFASPGNRAATGPLERFATMIKRGFSDMLGFAASRFDRMEVNGDTALQAVWLQQPDGRETGYLFRLGRQSGGEYDGMWMTDAVLPLGEGPRSGQSI